MKTSQLTTQIEWTEEHFVPNLTVCIPWDKSHPEYLQEAVNSVHPDIPIIVRYGNGTAGRGIQKCLEHVKTDYMFVLAADDILHPFCLRNLARAIGTADIAYPSLVKFGEQHGTFDAQIFSLHRLQFKNFIPGTFLVKTKCARDIGWNPDAPFEDWDFHYRASHAGYKYVSVREAIYFYRIHSSNYTFRIQRAANETGSTHEHFRSAICETPVPTYATFVCDLSAGSSYVRGQVPAKYLPGLCTSNLAHDNPLDQLLLDHPDRVTIFQYPALHSLPLINRLRELDRRCYADVDDDYTSPDLVQYLTECAKLYKPYSRIRDLWKTQRRYHRNICVSLDGIVCSTPEVAERYAKINNNIFLALNTIDFTDWPDPIKFDDGITRVGYACGLQHGPDTELVYDAFKEISTWDNVQVIMLGYDPGWDFDYQWIPPTPSTQVYRDVLSVLDIGVAPLRSNRFNLCKSDLKWLEYTMAYCATIAQNQRAYNQTLVDGKHGILVRNKSGWLPALKSLIYDKAKREELVTNSLEYVREHRQPWHMRDSYMYLVGHANARIIDLDTNA
jgi:hypothetical protein